MLNPMGFVSRDCISGLPDPLISHILSFLTTKEAASTSVLSKKWRYLFAFVTNLDFDLDIENFETRPSSMKFVDRVLTLRGNDTINKFSLNCDGHANPVRVTGWIHNALERNVSDLNLSLSEYRLPLKIFVSKTLVSLKLGPAEDLSVAFGVGKVSLPKLKILCIDEVSFEEGGVGFAKLLSGCPVLEELEMMNISWEYWKFSSVSIPALKRLRFYSHGEYSDENPKSVSFDTPNLVYLEYTDALADKYPKVNFGSLVEAHIGLRLTDDQEGDAKYSEDGYFSEGENEKETVGDAASFLVGISNVHTLYLSAHALEVLTYCCEATPIFNKLTQLTIESNSETGWDSLPKILKSCPNLNTLVLKRLVHKYNKKACGDVCCCKRRKGPSCLSSSPVKVVKIFMFDDEYEYKAETGQIEHFLKEMPCLEQLIVYYDISYDPSVVELSNKLQKISKTASPKCKIDVISQKISLSCTVPSSLTTKWSVAAAAAAAAAEAVSPPRSPSLDEEDAIANPLEYYRDYDDSDDDMYFY